MADGIKIGNQDVIFKVGSVDVDAIYLGNVLVYSGGTPPTPPTELPKYFEVIELVSGDTMPQGYIAAVGNIADSAFITKNMVLGDYPNGACCEITTTSYFQGDIVRYSSNTPTRAPQVDVYYNYKNSGGTLCEAINVTGMMSGTNTFLRFPLNGCNGNYVSMYYEDGTHMNIFSNAKYLCEKHPIESANTRYNFFTYNDAINDEETCYGISIDMVEAYFDEEYFVVEGVETKNERDEITYVEGNYYFVYNEGDEVWGVYTYIDGGYEFVDYVDSSTGIFTFGGDLGKYGGKIVEASEELLKSGIGLLQEMSLKWVTFSDGDTIPTDLKVYGIRGGSEELMDTFGDSTQPFYIEPYRRTFDVYLLGSYYEQTQTIDYTFSEISWHDLGDYINFNTQLSVRAFSFQLYIYA